MEDDQNSSRYVEESNSYVGAELAIIDHVEEARKYDDSCNGLKNNFHEENSIVEKL